MRIELSEAVGSLLEQDDILILSHQFPDGDTLGSACALCRGLQQVGKRVRMDCSDDIPVKYSYMFDGIVTEDFLPRYVVAVDIADKKLLGKRLEDEWGDKIDLCIDHHGSNVYYAKKSWVDSAASATAELIYDMLPLMGACYDEAIARDLYTGITTDTGCFRYSNTTSKTHRIAAHLIDLGVNAAEINRWMFETKTRPRMELERQVLDNLQYFHGGLCAIIYITQEMLEKSGATEGDLEGLAPIPRQIRGVKIGITLREKEDGSFKVSVRTADGIDACAICARMGGGGHKAAAGCNLASGLEQAICVMAQLAGEALIQEGFIKG